MIHRIYSNLSSFRELRLGAGLNIVLADTSENASDRQTLNSTGKTSLIELIHFVLGDNVEPCSIFHTSALAPWKFGLELDLGEGRAAIERSGFKHEKVYVRHADTSKWTVQPSRHRKSCDFAVSVEHWKSVLRFALFRLSPESETGRDKFSPRLRSLISYFARKHGACGFLDYSKHSHTQRQWDSQIAISYLLGLDWSVSQGFQVLREQEKSIQKLKRSLIGDSKSRSHVSVRSLRSHAELARGKARNVKRQIDEFNVATEFSSVEHKLIELTREIDHLRDQNAVDRRFLENLTSSLVDEQRLEISELEQLYREVEIVLPNLIMRHLDDAKKFHQAIIRNRKAHLKSEIKLLEDRIRERNAEKLLIRSTCNKLMDVLQSSGTFEQYRILQEEYSTLKARMQTLANQLATAEKVKSEQDKAKSERKLLKLRLIRDLSKKSDIVEEACVLFSKISSAIFSQEQAGSLTLEATEDGPKFDIHFEASRSHGISRMKVFCFDLVLTVIATRHGLSTGFLIHDSHLFDGVGKRQVARALQLGSAYAKEFGFQYIVTMNSEALPRNGFDRDFDISKYINPLRLNDAPDGGLFGVRFN